jgi:hypothetical protein
MQLWLTFEELGTVLKCDPARARNHVYANQWERRRGCDGVTRAVLPIDLMRDFLLSLLAQQGETPVAPAAQADEIEEAEEVEKIDLAPPVRKPNPNRRTKVDARRGRQVYVAARPDFAMPWIAMRPLCSPFAMAPA